MTDVIYAVLFHFGYSLSFLFIKQKTKTVQFVDLDLTVITVFKLFMFASGCVRRGFLKTY